MLRIKGITSSIFGKGGYLHLLVLKTKDSTAKTMVGVLVASGLAVVPMLGQAVDSPAITFPTSLSEGYSTTEPLSIASKSGVTPAVTGFAADTNLRIDLSADSGTLSIGEETVAALGSVPGYEKTNDGSISFTGISSVVNAALATLAWQAEDLSEAALSIDVSTGNGISFNNHYYEVVETESDTSWRSAYDAARLLWVSGSESDGLRCPGYLVNITTPEEQNFIYSKMKSDTWIGASDDNSLWLEILGSGSQTEGDWYWVDGPEKGTKFMTGNDSSASVDGAYNNFADGEPNNSSGENFGEMYAYQPGWNDLNGSPTLSSYVVEYGSPSCTPVNVSTALSAETTIQAGIAPYADNKPYNPQDFILGGTATQTPDSNETVLTQNLTGKFGATWARQRVCLSKNLEINAEVHTGAPGGLGSGADGLAFVIQPNSVAAGGSGGGLGYAGITPSLEVEFDTYANGGESGGHIALMQNGNTGAHATLASGAFDYGYLEDGNYRKFNFVWDAEAGTVTVKVDLNHDLTYAPEETIFDAIAVDLPTKFSATDGCAYWGFTAATGGSANLQKVKIDSYTSTGRRNLPPSATFEDSSIELAPSATASVAATLDDDATDEAQWVVDATTETSSIAGVLDQLGKSAVVSGSSAGINISAGTSGSTLLNLIAYDADGLSTTAHLMVLVGDSAAPLNLEAVADAGVAHLTWDAPTSPTDTAFTYELKYSDDGGATWTTYTRSDATSTTEDVKGLTPGVDYKFLVTANYTVASVAKSSIPAISNEITFEQGAPVLDLSGSAGNKKVTLTWTAPEGSSPTDYKVEYQIEGSDEWITFEHDPSALTSITVKGLKNGTSYVFRVTPIIDGSEGTVSDPSEAYTPEAPDTGGVTPIVPVDPPADGGGTSGGDSGNGTDGGSNGGSGSGTDGSGSNGATGGEYNNATDTPPAEVDGFQVNLLPLTELLPDVTFDEQNPMPQVLVDLLSGPIAYETDAATGAPVLPEIAPSNFTAIQNGKVIQVSIAPNASKSGFVISGDGWQLELNAKDSSGNDLKLDSDGNLILNSDRTVTFSGSGFAPGSYVQPWMFSSPIQFDKVLVGPDGTFTGSALVPEGVEVGQHTIQVNGISKDGQVRSVSIGVKIAALPAIAPAPMIDWVIFNTSLIVALILIAIFWLILARRRRNKEQPIENPAPGPELGLI